MGLSMYDGFNHKLIYVIAIGMVSWSFSVNFHKLCFQDICPFNLNYQIYQYKVFITSYYCPNLCKIYSNIIFLFLILAFCTFILFLSRSVIY